MAGLTFGVSHDISNQFITYPTLGGNIFEEYPTGSCKSSLTSKLFLPGDTNASNKKEKEWLVYNAFQF